MSIRGPGNLREERGERGEREREPACQPGRQTEKQKNRERDRKGETRRRTPHNPQIQGSGVEGFRGLEV